MCGTKFHQGGTGMETKLNKLILNQETLKNLTSETANKARADAYFKSVFGGPPFCTPVGGMN
jgi:hypothetical protein